ncbi:MAG: hypothetical protein MRZ66_03400 [Clostridiales bacterium]|nr:hypothetical protein [Clostridiales bacterium]
MKSTLTFNASGVPVGVASGAAVAVASGAAVAVASGAGSTVLQEYMILL